MITCDPINDRIEMGDMDVTMTSIMNAMDSRDKHWCIVPLNKSGKYLGIVFSHLKIDNDDMPKTLVMYGMAVHDVQPGEKFKTAKRSMRVCATHRWFKCPAMFLVGENDFGYKHRKDLFRKAAASGWFKGARVPKPLWENRMYPALENAEGVIVGAGLNGGVWANCRPVGSESICHTNE